MIAILQSHRGLLFFLLSFFRAEERDPDGLQDQRWGGGDFCTAACGSAAQHAVALARFKTFDGRSEPLTSFTDSLMFWSNAFVIVMSSFVISNLKFAMRLRLLKKQEVYGMDGWLANGIGSLAANSRTVTGVLELMYVRMTVHVCCFWLRLVWGREASKLLEPHPHLVQRGATRWAMWKLLEITWSNSLEPQKATLPSA